MHVLCADFKTTSVSTTFTSLPSVAIYCFLLNNVFLAYSPLVRDVSKVPCYIWPLGLYTILPFSNGCIQSIKESLFPCYCLFLFSVASKAWSIHSFNFLSFWSLYFHNPALPITRPPLSSAFYKLGEGYEGL